MFHLSGQAGAIDQILLYLGSCYSHVLNLLFHCVRKIKKLCKAAKKKKKISQQVMENLPILIVVRIRAEYLIENETKTTFAASNRYPLAPVMHKLRHSSLYTLPFNTYYQVSHDSALGVSTLWHGNITEVK